MQRGQNPDTFVGLQSPSSERPLAPEYGRRQDLQPAAATSCITCRHPGMFALFVCHSTAAGVDPYFYNKGQSKIQTILDVNIRGECGVHTVVIKRRKRPNCDSFFLRFGVWWSRLLPGSAIEFVVRIDADAETYRTLHTIPHRYHKTNGMYVYDT